MSARLIWIPFAFALGLLALIAWGLYKPADRTVRSALVGQTLPAFDLPPIATSTPPSQISVTNGFHHRRNCQRPCSSDFPSTT